MPGISLNVPHYKQEYHYSCVAACVRMVLAHYGRSYSEDELRQLLATGPHGNYAADMLRISSLGFDVALRSATPAELGSALIASIPPIVFLDTGSLDYWSLDCWHVAVLVGMDLTSVSLNDPFFDAAPQQASLVGFEKAWAANNYVAAFIRPRP